MVNCIWSNYYNVPQEFFTEDLWEKLPAQWREVLCGLSFPQIADLLLDTKCQEKRY